MILIAAKKKKAPPRGKCSSRRGVTYETTKFQNHCVAAAQATPYDLYIGHETIYRFIFIAGLTCLKLLLNISLQYTHGTGPQAKKNIG